MSRWGQTPWRTRAGVGRSDGQADSTYGRSNRRQIINSFTEDLQTFVRFTRTFRLVGLRACLPVFRFYYFPGAHWPFRLGSISWFDLFGCTTASTVRLPHPDVVGALTYHSLLFPQYEHFHFCWRSTWSPIHVREYLLPPGLKGLSEAAFWSCRGCGLFSYCHLIFSLHICSVPLGETDCPHSFLLIQLHPLCHPQRPGCALCDDWCWKCFIVFFSFSIFVIFS